MAKIKNKKENQVKLELQERCAHYWEDEGYEYDGEDIQINAKCIKCSAKSISKFIFVEQQILDDGGGIQEIWH